MTTANNMAFRKLVTDILQTFAEQNPKSAEILSEQLNSIESFADEINGYGAYSHLQIASGVRRLPTEAAKPYLNNKFYVQMEGLAHGLLFILSVSKDGLIDLLEIAPRDGINWDGVVRKYSIILDE